MSAFFNPAEKKFDYGSVAIGDLQVVLDENASTPQVTGIVVEGETLIPTSRFWDSLYKRLGIGPAVFQYYDHAEFFARVAERSRENHDRLRYTIERSADQPPQLLAVTDPSQPLIPYDDLVALVEQFDGENLRYANGILSSVHMPRLGNYSFEVGGDSHTNRFMAECPVDGYGLPAFFLMLMRECCQNGAVAMGRAFRSFVSLGRGRDNAGHSLSRAFDGFNSDEGAAALKQRMESAALSWASVREVHSASKVVVRCLSDGFLGNRRISGVAVHEVVRSVVGDLEDGVYQPGGNVAFSPLLKKFHEATGNITSLYQVANVDGLTVKRQSTLPAPVTVYDLINFVSELATHYALPEGSRLLQQWIGQQLSTEYDLEESVKHYPDFPSFWAS